MRVKGTELTPQHTKFVEEYLANGGNGKRAAMAAGVSEASAGNAALRWTKNPLIKGAIDRVRHKALTKAVITLEDQIHKAQDTYDAASAKGQYMAAVQALKLQSELAGFINSPTVGGQTPLNIDLGAIYEKIEDSVRKEIKSEFIESLPSFGSDDPEVPSV